MLLLLPPQSTLRVKIQYQTALTLLGPKLLLTYQSSSWTHMNSFHECKILWEIKPRNGCVPDVIHRIKLHVLRSIWLFVQQQKRVKCNHWFLFGFQVKSWWNLARYQGKWKQLGWEFQMMSHLGWYFNFAPYLSWFSIRSTCHSEQ